MQKMEGVHKWSQDQITQQVTLFLSLAFSAQRSYHEGVGPFRNCISFTLAGI